MSDFTFTAEQADDGERLDAFLCGKLNNISRSRIQKLVQQGNITINGKAAGKSCRIKTGDTVTADIPEPTQLNIEPENIPLNILYEDNYIIVVDKPQGMVVHPAAGHYSGTLVNALLHHCGSSLSGINGTLRPGIVHRIDKDTSGVIIAAKNDIAHISLAKQLEEHSMKRIYNAVVFGGFKDYSGTISIPIGRSPRDRKKMAVNGLNPRNAVSHYKVISQNRGYSLIELKLETGRTHQIRVHMTHIGHPLVGDNVYGPTKQPFKLCGQTLHARILGFAHPYTNQYMEFASPLPEYFKLVLKKLSIGDEFIH